MTKINKTLALFLKKIYFRISSPDVETYHTAAGRCVFVAVEGGVGLGSCGPEGV